jgi:hypothetical protein
MATDLGTTATRRKVLTAALGAAGALAASAITGAAPVEAAFNGNVQLGHGTSDSDNDSADETRVVGTTDGMTALSAVQAGSGTALYGYSLTGRGVLAVGASSGNGLDARSTNGTGAIGASFSGSGVYGYTGSTAAPPVSVPAGVVARAADTTRLALRVIGRAMFSLSGKAAVTAGHSTVTVTLAGVSTSSLIIATPLTNRTGVFVQSVVPAAGKFTVHLNKTVAGTTYVAYMVLG